MHPANKCSLCRKELDQDDNFQQFFCLILKAHRHYIPHICSTCDERYNGQVFWCPTCNGAWVRQENWPPNGGVRHNNTYNLLPCAAHTKRRDRPVLRCEVAGCRKQIIFTEEGPRGGRIYASGVAICEDHMPGVVPCKSAYCGTPLHPETLRAARRADGAVYCRNTCYIRDKLAGFPLEHPRMWEYKPGCTCRFCVWLADHDPACAVGRRQRRNKRLDTLCTGCGIMCAREDAKLLNDGEGLCHGCSYGATYLCEVCGHDLPIRMRTIVHTKDVKQLSKSMCEPCAAKLGTHWRCDVICKAWFPHGMWCNCEGIHEWRYKPKQSDLTFMSATAEEIKPEKVPFLGLELEVEALHHGATRLDGARFVRQTVPWVYLVHDGSLKGARENDLGGQFGFEIATFPFTLKWFNEHWPEIKDLLNTLTKKGFRSWEGGRCGMHVHISRGPMSDAHQRKFIHFFYGSSNLAMTVGQRSHASPVLQHYAPFDRERRDRLFYFKVKKKMNPDVDDHYCALNARSEHTLEARWFRGSLNPYTVRRNIEFIHSVWMFTREFGHTSANEMNYINWLRKRPQSDVYGTILSFIENHYITRR